MAKDLRGGGAGGKEECVESRCVVLGSQGLVKECRLGPAVQGLGLRPRMGKWGERERLHMNKEPGHCENEIDEYVDVP